MNVMTQAIKAAGIKTPSQMQRIWTFLKDSPRASVGLTSRDVAAGTGIGFSSVSSVLSDMTQRGMVCSTRLDGVVRYRANGSEYEALPARSKGNNIEAQRTREYQRSMMHAPEPVDPAVKIRHGVDLDTMTLGQIKSLLADIQALFNTK